MMMTKKLYNSKFVFFYYIKNTITNYFKFSPFSRKFKSFANK